MKTTKTLIFESLTPIFFLFTMFMWFFIQYDFAEANFYMFSVRGMNLAFGGVEGYPGFFIFCLPLFFSIFGIVFSLIAILNKSLKAKGYLYLFCGMLALFSNIIYIITYFHITNKFGNVIWTVFFWGAFALYCINSNFTLFRFYRANKKL